MSRLLTATAAVMLLTSGTFAADGPVFDPITDPRTAYDWSGFYIAHQLGWGWASMNLDDGIALDTDVDLNGAFFGGVLGLQKQWDWLVLGAEVEANWSDIDGKKSGAGIVGTVFGNIEIFGSAGVKAGVAWERFLFYGTGGIAGAEFGTEQRSGPASTGDHEASFGWMGGAGIDFAVTDNIIVGMQYRHYDFGKADFDMGFATDRTGDVNLDTISGHFVVKFGGL